MLDVYEPYLIQKVFLKITPCGRVAIDKAYKHFGKNLPGKQRSLF
ncbi:MAG: hypothetical protein GY757_28590 [bacterium]|nr:hypothetical protein [bacterium]